MRRAMKVEMFITPTVYKIAELVPPIFGGDNIFVPSINKQNLNLLLSTYYGIAISSFKAGELYLPVSVLRNVFSPTVTGNNLSLPLSATYNIAKQ
jgi:hypothetical protein